MLGNEPRSVGDFRRRDTLSSLRYIAVSRAWASSTALFQVVTQSAHNYVTLACGVQLVGVSKQLYGHSRLLVAPPPPRLMQLLVSYKQR